MVLVGVVWMRTANVSSGTGTVFTVLSSNDIVCCKSTPGVELVEQPRLQSAAESSCKQQHKHNVRNLYVLVTAHIAQRFMWVADTNLGG